MFAPALPFVTEEIWSWWRDGSVHLAAWPAASDICAESATDAPLTAASLVIAAVRRAKSEARLSQRAEAAQVAVTATADALAALRAVEADLRATGRISALRLEPSTDGELTVAVTL